MGTHVPAGVPDCLLDQTGKVTDTTANPDEGTGAGAVQDVLPVLGHEVEQRPGAGGRGIHRGHGRGEREGGGMPGIHPAEKGLDQSVDHGGAERGADEVADADIGVEARVGPLVPRPRLLGLIQDAAGICGIAGDAHEGAARQRMEAATGEHRCR